MKIDSTNVSQLKPSAQKQLLIQILDGLARFVENDNLHEELSETFLETLVESMDEADEDDAFGTEGWRHSILGED